MKPELPAAGGDYEIRDGRLVPAGTEPAASQPAAEQRPDTAPAEPAKTSSGRKRLLNLITEE